MQEGAKKPRTFEMKRYEAEGCIEKYTYMLIRPPRFTYNEDLLNPRRKYKGKYEHSVHYIPFALSVFAPANARYVILYLHGNSSSRYEGYSQLSHLPPDAALACFDFAGCGNRPEQQFISLGHKEAQEVDTAIRFLRTKHLKVAVWGRSMGAVSALLSLEGDLLIVDSPFSSLRTVAKQISSRAVPCACVCLFHCVFPCLFGVVGRDFEAKTGVDPEQLDVVSLLNRNTARRIMFLAAREDKMVHHSHSERLFDHFRGPYKKLVLFDGTHHSERPLDVLFEVFAFIEAGLFPPEALPAESRKSEKERGESEGEVQSFSLLRQERHSGSVENRASIKVEISSKLVEGGQTEKMERQPLHEAESEGL